MKIGQLEKRRIFKFFAMGKTPEEVADIRDHSRGRCSDDQSIRKPEEGTARAQKNKAWAEKLFEEYLALTISEKLGQTLLPECVSNRLHRLMDDIADLKRVDDLLESAAEKTLAPLLDIKRKIKERMAKESVPGLTVDASSDTAEEDLEREMNACRTRVFGNPRTQK